MFVISVREIFGLGISRSYNPTIVVKTNSYMSNLQNAYNNVVNQSSKLEGMVKRGENRAALRFINEGEYSNAIKAMRHWVVNTPNLQFPQQLNNAYENLLNQTYKITGSLQRGENAAVLRFMRQDAYADALVRLQDQIEIADKVSKKHIGQ